MEAEVVNVVLMVEKKKENIIVHKHYVGEEGLKSKVSEFLTSCYKSEEKKRNNLYLLNCEKNN